MYYYECRAIEVSLSAIILTLNAFECRAEWKTCAAKQHNFRTLFQPYVCTVPDQEAAQPRKWSNSRLGQVEYMKTDNSFVDI